MIVTPKSRKQLADEYKINVKTLAKWTKEKGIILPKGLLYPKKVEEIYEKLGFPRNPIF